VEWLAFLSQSRFVTAVDSSGTEDLYSSGRVFSIDVINVKKIIINVNKRVYWEKIVNVCKLEANVHKA